MSQATTAPPEPAVPQHSMRRAVLTASVWGLAATLLGAGLAVLIMLPFRPSGADGGSTGWEELGWAVLTLLLAATCALVSGALGIGFGLHRRRSPRAVVTGLMFMPVAVVLGVVTQGVGVLVAPAAAVWLVDGLARPRPDKLGDAPPSSVETRLPAWRRAAATGLAQRLVAAVVLTTLLTTWLLDRLGHRLGGELHGSWYVWLACLPVLAAVPTALLWRRTSWPALAGVVAVLAGVAALAAPGAVEGAHPTAAKLRHDVQQLGVPDGYRAASSTSALVAGAADRYGYELPVVVLVVAPNAASAPPQVPTPLRPGTDGTLPDAPPGSSGAGPLAATAVGHDAARSMKDRLVAAGWKEDLSAVDTSSTYWLPRPARSLLDASSTHRFSDGPWVRANLVPVDDAALLVVSTRP
ncbi:MAG TPA: hypothetical protein VFL94_09910 [Actinomycetales bacterium]|nr:hypothetical protein [Actinomycetales bacterium]